MVIVDAITAGSIRRAAAARPSGVSGSDPSWLTTMAPLCTRIPMPIPSPASASKFTGISATADRERDSLGPRSIRITAYKDLHPKRGKLSLQLSRWNRTMPFSR